jgi:serine/threonine protein kinase
VVLPESTHTVNHEMTEYSNGPETDDRVPGRIGSYEIDHLLGEGGMGKVYRAHDAAGGAVALKVVKDDFARDPVFRRRFQREASIASKVRHANVVPVLSTGEDDGVPYMAQRYVEGISLDNKLRRDGPLMVADAVRMCMDVAAGLEALWLEDMVHRDVKPGNILLDCDRAYITDFGLAKDNQGSVLTLPGQAVGSIDYMAPEQIRGEAVGPATDIYALGCVMYESLCGRPPFGSAQGMRVLWAHLQDDPPDPCQRRSDLSPGFAQALMRALEKDPAARPSSASTYATMLADAAYLAPDSLSAAR